ncbi:hypothetical protein FS935_05620 [Metabacillus litoralis]|uniref:DUF3221 domain-containing protein n=1 Tax=Metabacillus litoralis TaxID=152268 RepID=A0A5C6W388_9BACI|nr:hypothetical protein [Metabacillus litoralis]TXC91861.1 hypothetical protein FS935_05620 [Metabacillus litoralis]
MKIKLIILLMLSSFLIALAIYFVKPIDNEKHEVDNVEELEKYKTFTYLITEIKGTEYYGQSIDGKTKIYFDSEKMKHPIQDHIKINDKIIAYVEQENHVGGLVKVEKLKR